MKGKILNYLTAHFSSLAAVTTSSLRPDARQEQTEDQIQYTHTYQNCSLHMYPANASSETTLRADERIGNVQHDHRCCEYDDRLHDGFQGSHVRVLYFYITGLRQYAGPGVVVLVALPGISPQGPRKRRWQATLVG
jgi:hypothetical protein